MSELLPALPDDLALLCLARLSRRTLALCRCVSRALRDSLHPRNSTFRANRLQLGNRNEFACLFLCLLGWDAESVEFVLLDRAHQRCEVLPSPVLLDMGESVQAVHAHGQVLLSGVLDYYSRIKPDVKSNFLVGFEVPERRWYFDVQPTIQNNRVKFAWAKTVDYLYVAGGRPDKVYSPAYKSAERFNFVTQRWEPLPDMKEEREACTGFVMDGCFYVIGGLQQGQGHRRNCIDSAEFFDPRTNCWTLVPGMWPGEITPPEYALRKAPNVAVVKEELYALKCWSRQILGYDKLQSRWIRLGEFPEEFSSEGDHRLVTVGDEELWVLPNLPFKVPLYAVSCKPSGGRSELTWKLLLFDIPKRLRKCYVRTFVYVDDHGI